MGKRRSFSLKLTLTLKTKKILLSNRGSILVISLIIMVLSFLISLFIIERNKEFTLSSQLLIEKLYAQFETESVLEKLKFFIATGEFHSNYIKLPEYARSFSFPLILYIDGRKQKINNYTTLFLKDTGSYFNVWSPRFKEFFSFLIKKGIDRSEAISIRDSLIDWYDRDDLKHLNGAESFYYRFVLGAKFKPRNSNAIQSIYEWKLIKGMQKVFPIIKPYLCISPYWKPNLNTMDTYVIASFLDIPIEYAQKLKEIRDEKGEINIKDIERVTGKRITNLNTISFFPTQVLDVKVETTFNVANASIRCIISFRKNKDKVPFKILEWE